MVCGVKVRNCFKHDSTLYFRDSALMLICDSIAYYTFTVIKVILPASLVTTQNKFLAGRGLV